MGARQSGASQLSTAHVLAPDTKPFRLGTGYSDLRRLYVSEDGNGDTPCAL